MVNNSSFDRICSFWTNFQFVIHQPSFISWTETWRQFSKLTTCVTMLVKHSENLKSKVNESKLHRWIFFNTFFNAVKTEQFHSIRTSLTKQMTFSLPLIAHTHQFKTHWHRLLAIKYPNRSFLARRTQNKWQIKNFTVNFSPKLFFSNS